MKIFPYHNMILTIIILYGGQTFAHVFVSFDVKGHVIHLSIQRKGHQFIKSLFFISGCFQFQTPMRSHHFISALAFFQLVLFYY